jgi:CHAT domain-containing protein
LGASSNDQVKRKRARTAARRGLEIIENLAIAINPDIHADILLSLGSTYATTQYPGDTNLVTALSYYLKALELKENANNAFDVELLKLQIGDMIRYMLEFIPVVTSFAGQNKALEELELLHNVAKKINDLDLIFDSGISLCNIYSMFRLAQESEELARGLLNNENFTEKQHDMISFALASSLSEQGKHEEAIVIQESLISKNSKIFEDSTIAAAIWLNLGNSRRELEDIDGAKQAFRHSLELSDKIDNTNERKKIQSQLHVLIADLFFLSGKSQDAMVELKTAESFFTDDFFAVDRIHFYSHAGIGFFKVKMYEQAVANFEEAKQRLRKQLTHGSSPRLWQSMLTAWANNDSFMIQIHLYEKNVESTKKALVIAEHTKGRLLTWFKLHAHPQGAELALSDKRILKAVEKVQAFSTRNKTFIVSFFASIHGLAIFSVHDNKIEGTWFDDLSYNIFYKNYYEPLDKKIEELLKDKFDLMHENKLVNDFNIQLDVVLEKLGQYLEKSSPQLLQGGSDLVLIPHRLLRNLPLAYCKLHDGKRLFELFERVTIIPSISDMAELLDRVINKCDGSLARIALVDPDDSLPFARLEGFLTAKTDKVRTGNNVNLGTLKTSLSNPDSLLLSCHGHFNKSNPWRSTISLADGNFEILDILDPRNKFNSNIVVFGVCEIGKTQYSVSDEPIGFAEMLVQMGVKTVIAPLWPVHDIATLFFNTKFFQMLDNGIDTASAIYKTSKWLSQVDVGELVKLTDQHLSKLDKISVRSAELDDAIVRLEDIREWLKNEEYGNFCPFKSSFFWAPFHHFGINQKNL